MVKLILNINQMGGATEKRSIRCRAHRALPLTVVADTKQFLLDSFYVLSVGYGVNIFFEFFRGIGDSIKMILKKRDYS